ncbi:MAG: type II toxin-antitoxin system RelE/ParE family toxin [Campylobacterota bacterium]|nr:type II toxin-antitoxin system RelE/ParE family toxin [Campylobacterota bacterium]
MYPISFKSEVYDDVKTAYDWYEKQYIGLGEDFILILEDTYQEISQSPKLYQKIYKSVRRKLMRKFPYGIFFVLKENQIIVIAIMHTKRNPMDWSNRIK